MASYSRILLSSTLPLFSKDGTSTVSNLLYLRVFNTEQLSQVVATMSNPLERQTDLSNVIDGRIVMFYVNNELKSAFEPIIIDTATLKYKSMRGERLTWLCIGHFYRA